MMLLISLIYGALVPTVLIPSSFIELEVFVKVLIVSHLYYTVKEGSSNLLQQLVIKIQC